MYVVNLLRELVGGIYWLNVWFVIWIMVGILVVFSIGGVIFYLYLEYRLKKFVVLV